MRVRTTACVRSTEYGVLNLQSLAEAQGFAAIRSYLATAAKHDVGALDALAQLFGGEAWIPPRTT